MSEDAQKGLDPLKRPLTPHEHDLVRRLVEHSKLDASHLLSQTDRLSVFERCNRMVANPYMTRFSGSVRIGSDSGTMNAKELPSCLATVRKMRF